MLFTAGKQLCVYISPTRIQSVKYCCCADDATAVSTSVSCCLCGQMCCCAVTLPSTYHVPGTRYSYVGVLYRTTYVYVVYTWYMLFYVSRCPVLLYLVQRIIRCVHHIHCVYSYLPFLCVKLYFLMLLAVQTVFV